MTDAKMTREQAVASIDQVFGTEGGNLKGAQGKSDFFSAEQVLGFQKFLNSPEMQQLSASKYVGDIEKSNAAGAFADPRARNAQYEALGLQKDLTGEEITPEERFMMLQARQTEERDQRAAREAGLRDMSARGVRSGSSEMASILGGQEITSRNRQMGDLAAQANAQQRAVAARQAYGQQANELGAQTFDERFKTGTAADAVAQFNKQLKQDYGRWKDDFRASQQTNAFNRQDKGTDKAIAAQDAAFNRQRDVSDFYGRGAALKTAALTGGQVPDAMKVALGAEEAKRGEAALAHQDKRFNLLDPGSWF